MKADDLDYPVYDPEEPTALALLAAHLYYRALINIPVRLSRNLVGLFPPNELTTAPLVDRSFLVARVQGSPAFACRQLLHLEALLTCHHQP